MTRHHGFRKVEVKDKRTEPAPSNGDGKEGE